MEKCRLQCPYCGACLDRRISTRGYAISAGIQQPIPPYVTAGIQLSGFSTSKIRCPFCGREYELINFGGNHRHILTMINATKSVKEWLARWGLKLSEIILSKLTGVTFPKGPVFDRIVSKLKGGEKVIHLCFSIEREGKVWYGVLAGIFYKGPPMRIILQNGIWIIGGYE